MWYWSVAILFWQLSIDHIVNGQCKRCGFAKTCLRHPSLPFDSLPCPTRTICRRLRKLGQSRDNQTKKGWPYSTSMGLCPTRASCAREPRYEVKWQCKQIKNIIIYSLLMFLRLLFVLFKKKTVTYKKIFWNACILGSFIFSASWNMKKENLCSIFIFFKWKIQIDNWFSIFIFL